MKKKVENQDQSTEFNLKSKYMVILIFGIIICSIAILVGAIYLFISPGLISGLVFGAILIVFLILPVILVIIYYFKRIRKTSIDSPTKEESQKEKPKRVIQLKEIEK